MTFTFTADFKPGDNVTIKALERPATVTLVRIDLGGTVDYFVTWWDEGKRANEWLRADEIWLPNVAAVRTRALHP